MPTLAGQVKTALDCKEPALAFRTDIRSPDAWEVAWEARWPEASQALETWRKDQFQMLVEMWKQAAPSLQGLKREALDAGMPESAVLDLVVHPQEPFDTESGMREQRSRPHC